MLCAHANKNAMSRIRSRTEPYYPKRTQQKSTSHVLQNTERAWLAITLSHLKRKKREDKNKTTINICLEYTSSYETINDTTPLLCK